MRVAQRRPRFASVELIAAVADESGERLLAVHSPHQSSSRTCGQTPSTMYAFADSGCTIGPRAPALVPSARPFPRPRLRCGRRTGKRRTYARRSPEAIKSQRRTRGQCRTIAANPAGDRFAVGPAFGALRARCDALGARTGRQLARATKTVPAHATSTSRPRAGAICRRGRSAVTPEAQRRFDEKTAADRIAVCSLKIFPATANR